jgi:hypothetical protein
MGGSAQGSRVEREREREGGPRGRGQIGGGRGSISALFCASEKVLSPVSSETLHTRTCSRRRTLSTFCRFFFPNTLSPARRRPPRSHPVGRPWARGKETRLGAPSRRPNASQIVKTVFVVALFVCYRDSCYCWPRFFTSPSVFSRSKSQYFFKLDKLEIKKRLKEKKTASRLPTSLSTKFLFAPRAM